MSCRQLLCWWHVCPRWMSIWSVLHCRVFDVRDVWCEPRCMVPTQWHKLNWHALHRGLLLRQRWQCIDASGLQCGHVQPCRGECMYHLYICPVRQLLPGRVHNCIGRGMSCGILLPWGKQFPIWVRCGSVLHWWCRNVFTVHCTHRAMVPTQLYKRYWRCMSCGVLLCWWHRVSRWMSTWPVLQCWERILFIVCSAHRVMVPTQLYKRYWRALHRGLRLCRWGQRIAGMQRGHVQRCWGSRVQCLRSRVRLLLPSPVQHCNGRGMPCGQLLCWRHRVSRWMCSRKVLACRVFELHDVHCEHRGVVLTQRYKLNWRVMHRGLLLSRRW
jgi:hypothetical protein